MRLRNKPWAKPLIEANPQWVVTNPSEYRGKWQERFEKVQPLYIEVGMGKGRFIVEMAKKYPHYNFIGLEMQTVATGIALKMPIEQNVFAVVKREKLSGSSCLPFPYYSCDIIPGFSDDNFDSLVSLMSCQENCAASFQLIPTRFSQQEAYLLRELSSSCGQLASGVFTGGQTVQDPVRPVRTRE